MKLLQKVSIGTAFHGHREDYRFRFALMFGIASAVLIAINAILFSYIAANMAERRIIERDANTTTLYVNSIVGLVGASSYFHGDAYNPKAPEMEAFFKQLSHMPEVLGANVYGFDRSILWSSDPRLIGKRYLENDSLEVAFGGKPHPEFESFDAGQAEERSEHPNFPSNLSNFLETYVPILSDDSLRTVGAVEIYKLPTSLMAEINSVKHAIWLGFATGAAVLFVTLVIVLRFYSSVLAEQERRVMESEKYAVIGELTSAVAHGLRNPLAAIRSSAELLLDENIPDSARVSANDIVSQSERLEGWIRSFLTQARELPGQQTTSTAVDSVVRECLEGFTAQAQARGVLLNFAPQSTSPCVPIKKAELAQVINSLVSNSLEAIGNGGEITVRRSLVEAGRVHLMVEDNGPGIAPEVASSLFSPFASSKKSGLGVGLALARRIIERCGGTIQLANRRRRGARVTLNLPQLGA